MPTGSPTQLARTCVGRYGGQDRREEKGDKEEEGDHHRCKAAWGSRAAGAWMTSGGLARAALPPCCHHRCKLKSVHNNTHEEAPRCDRPTCHPRAAAILNARCRLNVDCERRGAHHAAGDDAYAV